MHPRARPSWLSTVVSKKYTSSAWLAAKHTTASADSSCSESVLELVGHWHGGGLLWTLASQNMSRGQFVLGVCLAFGIPALIYWELTGFHTRFAPRYSDRRLEELVVGQPRERALELLGEPLKTITAEVGEEWCYPESGHGALTFSPTGTLPNDVTVGEWCVRFASDGGLEDEFREIFGELDREQLRRQYGQPGTVWPSGLNERLVYSEPARAHTSWEWREVVVQAGRIKRLVSYPVPE